MALAALALAAMFCFHPIGHDGDTIRCDLERVRLVNIDAPELPGSERCSGDTRIRFAESRTPAWCNYELGKRSRAALVALVFQGATIIAPVWRNRYGRILGRVWHTR